MSLKTNIIQKLIDLLQGFIPVETPIGMLIPEPMTYKYTYVFGKAAAPAVNFSDSVAALRYSTENGEPVVTPIKAGDFYKKPIHPFQRLTPAQRKAKFTPKRYRKAVRRGR